MPKNNYTEEIAKYEKTINRLQKNIIKTASMLEIQQNKKIERKIFILLSDSIVIPIINWLKLKSKTNETASTFLKRIKNNLELD